MKNNREDNEERKEQPDNSIAQEKHGQPDNTPEPLGKSEGEAGPPPDAPPPADPPLIGGIDLDSISLDDDYADGMEADDAGVAAIPVGKPQRDWFFRTH